VGRHELARTKQKHRRPLILDIVPCVRHRKIASQGSLLAWAIVISILGRLYFASRPEIGLDDGMSADIAALPFFTMINFFVWNEPTMGLYYVLLHFWIEIAGNSPLALRMLSIVLSAAAVPTIYFLGCRLFRQSTGTIAAFLLAANATAIDFAQVIRSYSLTILLVIVSSFFFVRLIVDSNRKSKDLWLYIVASTLAVYAHLHAAFELVAQAVSACFRRTPPWRTLIASGVVVALAVLPLPLVTFGHYQGQSDWMTQVKLKWMAKVVPFLCGAPLFTKTPSAILLTLTSVGLALVGAFASDLAPRWNRVFTINGLFVPLGLCALLSLVKPAFFGESRYLLICLPFLVLLVALGIDTFRRPAIVLCAVMALEIWQVALRPSQYQTPANRSCFNEATDYLFSNARPGDGVALSWKFDVWRYWYYEARNDKNHARLHLVFPKWGGSNFAVNGVYVDNDSVPERPSAAWFEREAAEGGRLWIIIDPSHDNTTEQILRSVRALHIETQRTFPDRLKVILAQSRGGAPQGAGDVRPDAR
jgi:hypothetical protein